MRCAVSIALNRRSRYRCLISAALLLAFAVTAVGIPLPLHRGNGTNPVKSNDIFLCAMSNCGCATAEQCWRDCCCHSLGERLAWARANGIRPPEFAVAQARAAGHDLSWLDSPGGVPVAKTCRPNCCEKPAAQVTLSCCDNTSHHPPAKPARACCSGKSETGDADASRSVIAWRALKCSGKSIYWFAATPAFVSVGSDILLNSTPPASFVPPAVHVTRGVAQAPDLPPPEQA